MLDVRNASFLQAESTRAWVSQFHSDDQESASALLRAMTLVSRDEFADRLRALVEQRSAADRQPIGLYAERELRRRLGVPHRLFKQSRGRIARAHGVGPQPIQPTRFYDPEVGSEGLVAQLITELCRSARRLYLNHPGPDDIRKHRVRRIIVVTDLVGSGKRARDYIEAAWRVRSVRSWWSLGLLRFEVVAYAATASGRRFVEAHPSQPKVFAVTECPTIDSDLDPEDAKQTRALCVRYDPVDHAVDMSLGVGGLGTLIAFAHGVPNNAPRILHKAGRHWCPLFPARVTSALTAHFGDKNTADAIADRLIRLRQSTLARAPWLQTASPATRLLFLVMAAASRSPRSNEVLARRTGLTVLDTQSLCDQAISLGWMDEARRLTDRGVGELAHARSGAARQKNRIGLVPWSEKSPYYPKSLRAPTLKSR